MIECQSNTINDHKHPFQKPLVSILKFKGTWKQVENKIQNIEVQHGTCVEHHPTPHNLQKRGKSYIWEQGSIEKVKDDPSKRIQKHDKQKPVNQDKVFVCRNLPI